MSTNGSPPLGASDTFPHDDEEEMVTNRNDPDALDAKQPAAPGMGNREGMGTSRDLERKAEEIVIRENGVRSFADAEDEDEAMRDAGDRAHAEALRDEGGDADIGTATSTSVEAAMETMTRSPDEGVRKRRL